MKTDTDKKELPEVHLLRASASLLVVIFHLFLGNINLFPSPSIFKEIFKYGYLGVEVFFMLSGYIICYALPKNYSYSNLIPFLTKRLIRIYPAYLISMTMVLVLNSASHYITHLENHISGLDIFSNVFFLANFGLGEYLNIVYWTLGIEFQFYILIGLIFNLISNRTNLIIYILCLLLVSSLQFTENTDTILRYLSIFGLGMLVFFFKKKKLINFRSFAFLALLLLIQIYFFLGISVLIISLLSLLTLLFWDKTNVVILFFSNISFSLYLIHVSIGGKIINLGLRLANTLTERYLLFFTALVVTIFCSYLFYLLVERPAMLWSKKIKYKANNQIAIQPSIAIK